MKFSETVVPFKWTAIFCFFIGVCKGGELTSIYFKSTTVIVNRNFTSDFLNQFECPPCENLAAKIQNSIWSYFDFLMTVRQYSSLAGSIENKTVIGQILFGSPREANGSDTYLPPVRDTRDHMENVHERGIYFVFYMKLDFNMSNPAKNKFRVGLLPTVPTSIKAYFKENVLRPTDLEFQHNLQYSKFIQVVQRSDAEGNFTDYLNKSYNAHVNLNVGGKIIPKEHRKVLHIISYTGCACSAIGLSLTILTVALSRKLRRIRANQILIQLCIALLAALLMFVFGTQNVAKIELQETCKALAAILHYFLLSSIVWMSIQAYNLYQDIVKVFDTSTITQTEFMIRVGVIGWVVPALVVVATGLAKSTSYGVIAIGNNTDTSKCWMEEESYYGAFLAPVLLLMLLNTVAFIVVMREILKIPRKQEKSQKMAHFRASLSIFVLLGLNWIFAGLAATDTSLVFWYLFTITCSFQGFLIFVMHGIIKKDFQEVWKALTYTNRVLDALRTSQKTSSTAMSNNSTSAMVGLRHSNFEHGNGGDGDSGIEIHVNAGARDNLTNDKAVGNKA